MKTWIFSLFLLSASLAGAQRMNASEFQKALQAKGGVLVDVRTAAEFASGHLNGAILIDFREPSFLKRMEAYRNKPSVLIYCASGNRSGQALQQLNGKGFKNVSDLLGGMGAWRAAGYPVKQ